MSLISISSELSNISEHKARELARLKAIPQHCFRPACPTENFPVLQKWGELPMLWGDLASDSCSGDPTSRVSLSSSACSQILLPSKPSLNALLLHLTPSGGSASGSYAQASMVRLRVPLQSHNLSIVSRLWQHTQCSFPHCLTP